MSLTSSELRHHLSSLSSTAPFVMAHERLLPVPAALAPLFGVSGEHDTPALVRGQTVACTGSAATSCALTLMGSVTRAGFWAAVVGVPSVGVVAAADMGVALERAVFVADPRRTAVEGSGPTAAHDVATVLSALVDGFEMVVIPAPIVTAVGVAGVRRLQSRAHTKGVSLVVVGTQSALSADVHLVAEVERWEGIGQGHGHLQRRLVRVALEGRRRARPTRCEVWLPDARGQMSAVVALPETGTVDHTGVADHVDTVEAGVVVPFRRAG